MIKAGNSWKDLDVGATVDSSSLIQLKKDSFVEFSYAGTTLVLSTEGIYFLEKFLANGAKQEKERAAKAFSELLVTAPADQKMEYQNYQPWGLASANDLVGSIKFLRSMFISGPFAIQQAKTLQS